MNRWEIHGISKTLRKFAKWLRRARTRAVDAAAKRSDCSEPTRARASLTGEGRRNGKLTVGLTNAHRQDLTTNRAL
jgi:hypothetical protein